MSDTVSIKKNKRPSCFAYFLTTVVTLTLIFIVMEILLRAADPWGIRVYQDLDQMTRQSKAEPLRGYVNIPGRHEYHNWYATILDETYTRVVSGTNPTADCKIVFIGDSTTFGHGVSDGQTWVDVLGNHFSDVYFLNAGVSRYNYRNIAGSIHAFPDADGYIYLLDDNDVDPSFGLPKVPDYSVYESSFVIRYLWFFILSRSEGSGREFTISDEVLNAYLETYEQEFNQENVLVLAFRWGSGLVNILQGHGYEITLIEPYTETVSLVDIHPSVRSSKKIGENLIPIVEDFKEKVCSTGE